MSDIPLTPEQRLFATEHHDLVYAFLNSKHLSETEFYDVIIFGYLDAVCDFLARKDLQRYSFSTIAWRDMSRCLSNYYRDQHRQKRTATVISIHVPRYDNGLPLEETIESPGSRAGAEGKGEAVMVQYRNLLDREINRDMFRQFIRRQVVGNCYRWEKDHWEIREDPFIDDWSEDDYQVLIRCLKNTVSTGGFVQGAFRDGVLKGFASVEAEFLDEERRYLDLSSIHVSSDARRMGIGKRLFLGAVQWARKNGAEKLYISAHSAVESQAFYRSLGCVDALWRCEAHVEQEPYDCQLEYAISMLKGNPAAEDIVLKMDPPAEGIVLKMDPPAEGTVLKMNPPAEGTRLEGKPGAWILEGCVDSVESAVTAWEAGAGRLELCANLMIGGTTPSLAAFRQVKRLCRVPVHVLIRPRPGDFCYTKQEFALIREEISIFRKEGADGIVIGILKPDGRLDLERMKLLMEDAQGMSVTLHRAFDVCADPYEALEQAAALGIHTILTSGGRANCIEGIQCLGKLMSQADGQIRIMAGGGVDASVIPRLFWEAGIRDFHMSGKMICQSPMTYRKGDVHMGAEGFGEYELWRADGERFREAARILDQQSKQDREQKGR